MKGEVRLRSVSWRRGRSGGTTILMVDLREKEEKGLARGKEEKEASWGLSRRLQTAGSFAGSSTLNRVVLEELNVDT